MRVKNSIKLFFESPSELTTLVKGNISGINSVKLSEKTVVFFGRS